MISRRSFWNAWAYVWRCPKNNWEPVRLIDCLRTVPDPRSERNRRHDLAEILICLILGYTAGKVSIRKALARCGRPIKWIRRYIALKNGVASVPTTSRVLSQIDEELCLYAFTEWIGERLETRGIHLIIDGRH